MWNHIQLDKWILACNDFIASIGLTNTHVFIFGAIVLVRRSMDGRRQKEYCMIAFHFVNTFFGSKNSLSLFQLRFIGMSHHLHILAVFFSMTNPLTNPIRDRLENCLALLSSKLSETFVKFRSTEKWFKLVFETWYTHYQRVCKLYSLHIDNNTYHDSWIFSTPFFLSRKRTVRTEYSVSLYRHSSLLKIKSIWHMGLFNDSIASIKIIHILTCVVGHISGIFGSNASKH